MNHTQTYNSKICLTHPELNGLRYKGSGECTDCHPIKARMRYMNTRKNKKFFRAIKYKASATRRGLEFNLTDEYLESIWTGICPILKTELIQDVSSYKGNGESFSHRVRPALDRIDNTKGYIIGNVVWVSMFVNFIKSDATIDELESIVSFYKGLKNDQI